jgi:hypothetical protein
MKTSELVGIALDWAVCKALGLLDLEVEIGAGLGKTKAVVIDEYGLLLDMRYGHRVAPSISWDQGGQVIDMANISLLYQYGDGYEAYTQDMCGRRGPTPLIAAMRCYVDSVLGDEVNIPEELLQ